MKYLKQKDSIIKSKYIYFSFSSRSFKSEIFTEMQKFTILLAQHFGNRMENDLRKAGFTVINLPSRKWISIGNKTRIILFNNEIQTAQF